MTSQADRVVGYYNQTRWEYRHLWKSDEALAIHFGYFDETVRDHRESLVKINEVLAQYLGIARDDRVLDAGCGIGGSALWMAEHAGCQVTGINITPYQVQMARSAARQRGLDDSVRFELADFTQTGLPSESFTVIWALESVVHAEHKEDFAAEARRLLAPGGRLMIAEYLVRDEPILTEEERIVMVPWLEGWAMPNLFGERQYREVLAAAGFDGIRVVDISKQVEPSLDRLARMTSLLLPLAPPLRWLRIIKSGQLKNARAVDAQIRAFKAGLWRYKVVLAHRPAEC
jgi:tocopherol O-methyltransferase